MKTHVRLNFASSLDGKISSSGGMPFKFSNFEDMERVHRLRSISDIILVGKNTINRDDPKLVVNSKYYKSSIIPDVAILDSNIEVRGKAKVFSYPRKVIIICGNNAEAKQIQTTGEGKVIVKKCGTPTPTVREALDLLNKLGYENVMVEGGKSTITSFLNEGLWDEISIFFSPYVIGEDGTPMTGKVKEVLKFGFMEVTKLGDGFLVNIKKEF